MVHGAHIMPFSEGGPLRRALFAGAERLAARRTDLVLSVSHAVGHAYAAAGMARPDQIHCVRSGFDLARFTGPRPPADERRLRGHPRNRVLLMLAALEPRKRHAAFLRALAAWREQLTDVRVLLAGQGALEPQLRQMTHELGLEDHVKFIGHRADPEALLAMADAAVLTSAREGLPRVAVQAMAVGVPVVMNDLPGLNEVIGHRRNGMVLPPDDVGAVAAEALALLQDPVRLQHLRSSAQATDVTDWALGALGRRTTELYRAALEDRPETQEWVAA